jgi:hypothetical protein
MKHLGVESLIKYLENDMLPAERKDFEAHLVSCEICQGKLTDVRRMLGATEAHDELVSPPEDLMQRVVTAFRRRLNQSADRLRRQAVLQFDSWTHLSPVGVRGMSHERQLLFSESTWDLDLQIVREREEDTFALRGQILGEEVNAGGLEGIELRVTDSEGAERRGLTDHLGCFNFTRLSEGTYSVQVFLDDYDLVLDSVVLVDAWASATNGEEAELVD